MPSSQPHQPFEHSHNFTAFQSDYGKFDIEVWRRPCDGEQRLICHFTLARWSPSILKACLKDYYKLRTTITDDLYASPIPHEGPELKKWERFVTLMGFVPLSTVLCNDGAYRPLYI